MKGKKIKKNQPPGQNYSSLAYATKTKLKLVFIHKGSKNKKKSVTSACVLTQLNYPSVVN